MLNFNYWKNYRPQILLMQPYITTYCRVNWIIDNILILMKSFPGGSVVKNMHTRQESWVWSLGWEDPLEKEMAPVFLLGKSHGQRSLCYILETWQAHHHSSHNLKKVKVLSCEELGFASGLQGSTIIKRLMVSVLNMPHCEKWWQEC